MRVNFVLKLVKVGDEGVDFCVNEEGVLKFCWGLDSNQILTPLDSVNFGWFEGRKEILTLG